MVWHYHDDDVPGPSAEIQIAVIGLPAQARTPKLEHLRIDDDHSNAFVAWKRMGSPQQPTPEQYAQLEKAGQLTTLGPTQNLQVENGTAIIRLALPRQAVSLLKLSWEN
jgi:xylan 1,4-beta-xylosidase